MPIPASRVEEIGAYLSDVISAKQVTTEMDLARTMRDVAAIRQRDLVLGSTLEGIVRTLQHRPDEAVANFELAMKASSSNPMVAFNYGSCLFAMGSVVEARPFLGIAARTQEFARDAIKKLFGIGAVAEAVGLVKDLHIPADTALQNGLKLGEFLAGSEISDTEVLSVVGTASRLVWEDGLWISGAYDYITADGVLRTLIVPSRVTDEQIVNWEWSLDEKLVQSGNQLSIAGFSIAFATREESFQSMQAA